MEQALLATVGLHQLDALRRTARELEVAERLRVDREDRAGGAHLGRHVPDRRAVGKRQVRQPGAIELDELAHHAALAQHLGDGEHEVRGGGTLRQLAAEPEADHLRNQHRHRLAEHGRLGLDAADTPAEHAQPVHHRGVRVGPDQRVGERLAVARLHHACQVFEVHLVADAGVRRHHREVVEGLLAPAQEGVALLVALELELRVALEREPLGEHVHLDRVVDHELHRHQRVDLGGVPTEVLHGVAHGGEVDDRRHSREVLHQHAGGPVGDLLGRLVLRRPLGDGLGALVLAVAQQVLEQHLQRVGKARDVVLLLERVQPEDLERLAADVERRAGAESCLNHSPHRRYPATRGRSLGTGRQPIVLRLVVTVSRPSPRRVRAVATRQAPTGIRGERRAWTTTRTQRQCQDRKPDALMLRKPSGSGQVTQYA